MQPLLLVAATYGEVSLLIGRLGGYADKSIGSYAVHTGVMGKHQVIIAVSGMGKVNTAICLTTLLEQVRPLLVISTGCAGAFTGCGLDVGSLALSSGTVYGDEGVLTPTGWESLELVGIPLLRKGSVRYFNEYPVCEEITRKAMSLAAGRGISIRLGRSVTVSTCSGTSTRGRELQKRFNAISENMEGAAAAHVALKYGTRFMEIRGISNFVEDRDLSRWNIPLATDEVQRFLACFIETI